MVESTVAPTTETNPRISAPRIPPTPRSILVLIEQLTVPGGSERQCIELARAHATSGLDVEILTLEGTLSIHSAHADDERLTLRTIGRSRVADLFGALHPKLGQAWEMRRLARAARDSRAEVVLAHHYPAQWASAAISRRMRIPAIWLCNDWIYNPIAHDSGNRLRIAAKSLLRRVMIWFDTRAARQHDLVLALSHMTGAQIANGYGVNVSVFRTGATAPLHTVHSKESARAALGIPRNAFVASTVCILMPHRRVEDAILAMAALPRALRDRTLFVHAGGSDAPEYVEQLRRVVAQSGTENHVRFLGAIDEIDRANLLAASDVFIFPVQGQSWGLAPFEAIASELPVIVSRSSGAAEVLHHGRTALLYEPGDVASLARHLASLATDVSLGERLRRNGTRLWHTRFTWQRAARRMNRHLRRAQRHRGDR